MLIMLFLATIVSRSDKDNKKTDGPLSDETFIVMSDQLIIRRFALTELTILMAIIYQFVQEKNI